MTTPLHLQIIAGTIAIAIALALALAILRPTALADTTTGNTGEAVSDMPDGISSRSAHGDVLAPGILCVNYVHVYGPGA